MSLGNMRENGVRWLDIYCACGHHAAVNVDQYPDHLGVPYMAQRFRCSACGQKAVTSRPSWLHRTSPRAHGT